MFFWPGTLGRPLHATAHCALMSAARFRSSVAFRRSAADFFRWRRNGFGRSQEGPGREVVMNQVDVYGASELIKDTAERVIRCAKQILAALEVTPDGISTGDTRTDIMVP